jgi:hypothetical protein
MLLLYFLAFCIGDIDLWPCYILDLLFVQEYTTPNISFGCFFYRHGVPLKMAGRVYANFNPNRASAHVVPFIFGGYYAFFDTRQNTMHMAQYYDVRYGRLMWLNGRNLSQHEPVLPSELVPTYLDCRTLRGCQVPSSIVQVMCSTMLEMCDEEAFDIMDF